MLEECQEFEKKVQKQAFTDFLQDRCYYNLRKFYRKTLVLESLFNKVAGFQACKFIKKRLQHKCFSVKFVKFLRSPFFTEHLRCLLLKIGNCSGVVSFFRRGHDPSRD